MVQSPILKQAFAFDDGGCLDDPTVSVPVYPARRTDDGQVQIGRPDEAVTGTLARRNLAAMRRAVPGCRPSGSVTISAPAARSRS